MTRFIVEIKRAGKPALRFAVPDDGLTFGGGPDADVALPAMGSSLITLRPESDDLRVAAIRPTQGDLPPRLGNGESCKIGALTMRLRVEKSPVREPTRELRLEPDKRAVQVRRLALEIKDDPARRPRAHQLLNGRTIVGGDPDCDVHVADPYVSARHLAIDAYDGQLIIHDLASTNGTFIDGERVDAAPVHVGQTITLGNTHLTVSAKEFLEQIPPPSRPFPALIGDAPVFLDVLAIAAKVAETGVTLLITGETGTGKGELAKAVHKASPRRDAPFVAVNCGAMPRDLIDSELFGHVKGAYTDARTDRAGCFAKASGGTIFLDEIGELPLDLQVKLLRVLEERRVKPVGSDHEVSCDVRIIAATNKDLAEAVNEGAFRQDLYYRLNHIPLRLPPLRKRREDIPTLVDHFARLAAKNAGAKAGRFDGDAMARLVADRWPGNVRQLQIMIERTLLLHSGSGPITEADLRFDDETPLASPGLLGGDTDLLSGTLQEMERSMILTALRECGAKQEAARRLGIAPSTLYAKIEKYGLDELRDN